MTATIKPLRCLIVEDVEDDALLMLDQLHSGGYDVTWERVDTREAMRAALERQPWDKRAPGPALPADVVAGTRARYVAAFERITGASFDRYLEEDMIAS